MSIMTAAEIAAALEGKRSGRQFLARCPAHDDLNPSLSIAERDGKVLVKCFAGCEQTDVIDQLKVRGLWPESSRREHPPEWGTIFRTYDYTDENGTLLYQICRFVPPYEPPPKEWGKCKPRRPDGCGWRWGYGNVRRVVYRLPELLEAPIVFVPEGEKDCESLREYGFVATTNSGGAESWREEFNPFFVGRQVIILPDDDPPGWKQALRIARGVLPYAAAVSILELPGAKDISDWFAHGHSEVELLALLKGAPHAAH